MPNSIPELPSHQLGSASARTNLPNAAPTRTNSPNAASIKSALSSLMEEISAFVLANDTKAQAFLNKLEEVDKFNVLANLVDNGSASSSDEEADEVCESLLRLYEIPNYRTVEDYLEHIGEDKPINMLIIQAADPTFKNAARFITKSLQSGILKDAFIKTLRIVTSR